MAKSGGPGVRDKMHKYNYMYTYTYKRRAVDLECTATGRLLLHFIQVPMLVLLLILSFSCSYLRSARCGASTRLQQLCRVLEDKHQLARNLRLAHSQAHPRAWRRADLQCSSRPDRSCGGGS